MQMLTWLYLDRIVVIDCAKKAAGRLLSLLCVDERAQADANSISTRANLMRSNFRESLLEGQCKRHASHLCFPAPRFSLMYAEQEYDHTVRVVEVRQAFAFVNDVRGSFAGRTR